MDKGQKVSGGTQTEIVLTDPGIPTPRSGADVNVPILFGHEIREDRPDREFQLLKIDSTINLNTMSQNYYTTHTIALLSWFLTSGKPSVTRLLLD